METKDLSKVQNKIRGDRGEILAAQFLQERGYKILQQNYKNKIGEIDIIAEKDKYIVFVEVKCRSTLAYGRPCEAVNFHKQNKIRRVAEFWLIAHRAMEKDVRFDVVEVVGQDVNLIEDAF